MPSTESPPTETRPPTVDTGIAQGAPSTGARPSSFRPPNPALEAAKQRMFGKFGYKSPTPAPTTAPTRKPEPVQVEPAKPEPPKPDERKTEGDRRTVSGPDSEGTSGRSPEDLEKSQPGTTPPEAGVSTSEEGDKPNQEGSLPAKEKKTSPWRVIDDYKKTTSELKAKVETYEKEIASLKSSKPAEVPKDIQDRLTAAEAKVKEYEDDIRFSNYQRHPEFIEKYQKPYFAAFAKATAELSEVAVTDPNTGATRPATAEDMQMLLSLPLGKAREVADQMFGAFANDAMAHRRDIKAAFDAQKMALEDAKKNGAAREKQWRDQQETQQRQTREVIENTWSAARRESTTDPTHGKYFTPVEGDQKGNAALAKGLEFADKVFKLNPLEPGISNEERADRVKRHAAAYYRQAAYPRMKQWIEERDTRIAELEKQLDEFGASEPAQVGEKAKTTTPSNGQPAFFDRFKERLRKNAR